MACCLTAPSHYLNQCWRMISEILWHSPDNNFTENTQEIYCWNEFEIYQFKTVKSPRCQWVNSYHAEYIVEIIKMCLHFWWFLNTEMVQQFSGIFLIEDKDRLSCMVNAMAADDLATQGARASEAMVSLQLSGILQFQHQKGWHIETRSKWTIFGTRHFQMYFL